VSGTDDLHANAVAAQRARDEKRSAARAAARQGKQRAIQRLREESFPPYTEEMRQRAQDYIANKDAEEDRDLIFRRYVQVCFAAFQRRIDRAKT
jgi:hypothetical protein